MKDLNEQVDEQYRGSHRKIDPVLARRIRERINERGSTIEMTALKLGMQAPNLRRWLNGLVRCNESNFNKLMIHLTLCE